MRIVLDTQTRLGSKTGFGFYVNNLVKQLEKIDQSNQYTFIQPANDKDFSTPRRLLWDQLTFPWLANRAKADIIHQPCFSTPIIHRGKVVVTIHDLISVFFSQNFPFWSGLFFGKFMPMTYRFADHLIAVSEHTKNDAIKVLGLDPSRITVIHEAADERFHPNYTQAEIKIAKAKYHIPDAPYLVHVGTLEPRKNLNFLVEAFAKAIVDPQVKGNLVIAGKKGWYYEGLFALVERLKLTDRVIFTGYVADEDIPRLMVGATALVFPSHYEGFGLPPLEAMASGTPVISSNTSSMPEVVNGAGLLLEPTDLAGWAIAIQRILTDTKLQQELSQKGLARAKQFSWEKCARETIAIYEKVYRGEL